MVGVESVTAAPLPAETVERKNPEKPFRLALNLATLNGFKLSLEEQIEVAAKAGYEAIEPWSGSCLERGSGMDSMALARFRSNSEDMANLLVFGKREKRHPADFVTTSKTGTLFAIPNLQLSWGRIGILLAKAPSSPRRGAPSI